MEWIPCTERLPEKNGRYLVTRKFSSLFNSLSRKFSSLFNSLDDVFIVNYSEFMGVCVLKRIWWISNPVKPFIEEINDVIAWMPLPELYKGGEQDG